MPQYTLKIVKIEYERSIGRQLKATVTAGPNTNAFGFNGTSTRHRIIAKDVLFLNESVSVPIEIEVSEVDAKASDKPFYGKKTVTIEATDGFSFEMVVDVAEKGGAGKNKSKTATLRFSFEVEVPFSVRAIPGIMRAISRTTGAAVMNRWFDASGSRQTPDTTTIKLKWVLSYPRAGN